MLLYVVSTSFKALILSFCYFKNKAEISRERQKVWCLNFFEHDFLMSMIQSKLSYPENLAGSFHKWDLVSNLQWNSPLQWLLGENDSAVHLFLSSPNFFCLPSFYRRGVLVQTLHSLLMGGFISKVTPKRKWVLWCTVYWIVFKPTTK